MHGKIRSYIVSILIPLGVGGLSALLTRSSMENYGMLEKPPLSPPDTVFPIVWTILFVLMGVGAAMIWLSDSKEKSDALKVYGLQLIVNFFWTILFFNLEMRLFAFIWLLLLLVLVVRMFFLFKEINPTAAYLQIPYILWLIFAAYLNFGVWFLNR